MSEVISKIKKDNPWIKTKGGQITLNALVIGFLIALMNIPLGLVKSIIEERGSYQKEATLSIEKSWGGKQLIVPIILSIPITESYFATEIDKETKIIDRCQS